MTPGWGRMARIAVSVLLVPAAVVLIWLAASGSRGGPTGPPTSPATTSTTTSSGTSSASSTSGTTTGSATDTAPVSRQLKVVGLGDSVMSGTNCDCDGIVAEYAAALQARDGGQVSGTNLGVPGDTTSDLLDHLENMASYRTAVRNADIVLVIIGANDLEPQRQQWESSGCDDTCYDPAVAQMGTRLDAILSLVRSLRSQPPATVLVTDYWNVFTDGAVAMASGGQPQIDWSQDITLAANSSICSVAKARGATCVDLYTPIQTSDPTSLLAPDGDHPNAAGVTVIVHSLVAATPDH